MKRITLSGARRALRRGPLHAVMLFPISMEERRQGGRAEGLVNASHILGTEDNYGTLCHFWVSSVLVF